MKFRHNSAGWLTTALAVALLTAAAAPASAASNEVSGTIRGQTVTAANTQTINMEQSTVMNVDVHSTAAVNLHAADSRKVGTNLIHPFASGASTYSLYAMGAPNTSVGIYTNSGSDSRLFVVHITPRPFASDTTVDFHVPVGNSYTFRITPQNASDYVTFYTTDGSMFSTSVAGKSTADGKTNYYFRVTAQKIGYAGVYVTVGKTNYRVFTATADAAQHSTTPSTPAASKKTGTVSADSLNVRSQASSGSSIVGNLSNGEKVTVLSDPANGWVKVQTAAGLTGYCSSDYIKIDSGSSAGGGSSSGTTTKVNPTATVSVGGGTLNLRSGPSASANVIGQLLDGEAVTVLDTANGWTHVQTAAGVKGYCSSDYLVAVSSGKGSNTTASSKTLSGLPAFKQNDAAWANTWIGGADGGSIGSIGCTVTDLAMSESYRLQSNVTPNDIANQCEFTEDGGLYWPSNYYVLNASDANLTAVFQQLKADKPVIVGGNGLSPHWVVIKGYKNVPLDASGNPTSLDASMFLINDPGYNNYTLADYIRQFPSGRVYRSYH